VGSSLRSKDDRSLLIPALTLRHCERNVSLKPSAAIELDVHLEGAAAERDPLVRTAGLVYVEFALQNRGLFGLMFGPILAERVKYPELAAGFDVVKRMVARAADGPSQENAGSP
jgi:hypothetical protein